MSERCEWTIVRFYPDPLNGERINLGVVVITGEQFSGRFLRNWSRMRSFARGDFRDIYRLAQRMSEMTVADIRWQAENGNGTIQFDPIQPSLEAPKRLLERLAERYLVDAEPMRLRPLERIG